MRKRNSQENKLDQRLTGYSAGAKKLRARAGNWPVYAAAAGSALAMTTNASANIISGVYTGTGPNGGVAVQPGPGGSTSIKVLTFGAGKINLKAKSGVSTYGPFGQLSVEGVLPIRIFQSFPTTNNAKNFGAGAMISAGAGTLAVNARIVGAFFSSSLFGAFSPGQPGYVGFAYNLGGGNLDYGWLKVDFVKVGNLPNTLELEALAWGIELDQNHKIAAGDTGVPEPGTMALGILAAGAAGVAALRRRRKVAAAQAA